jgi:hypothetical protein
VSQFFRLLKRIQIMFSLRKRETRAPRATLWPIKGKEMFRIL